MKRKLWINIEYPLKENQILTKPLITEYIDKFFTFIFQEINEKEQYLVLIFRIKLSSGNIKTVTKLQKLNRGNKQQLIDHINDKIGLITNSYFNEPIQSIIISYGVRKGVLTESTLDLKPSENLNYHIYYNNKLPISINPLDYGTILKHTNQRYLLSPKKNVIIDLEVIDSNHHISYFKNSLLMYEWTDKINKEENSIIREIGKTTIYWKEGEIKWIKVLKNFKTISKKRASSHLNQNFITMDLETLSNKIDTNKEILELYLLCWYDGNKKVSYLINPLEGAKEIIYRAMKDICKRKYNNFNIYLHNFAKFDAIFLINHLAQIGECNPIIHKGKIISFEFKYNDITITFRDSYLLLLSSLGKLSKSFSVENPKTIFPIFFNDIDYIGGIPDFKYFPSNISLEEYNNYKDSFNNKLWCFKEEAINYCLLDCISLYQILCKFNILIFKTFHLDFNDYPTLSALAFAIFRTKYLKEFPIEQSNQTKKEDNINKKPKYETNIAMLSGDVASDIRQSYTGGSTDMFIPKNPLGTNIHVYDVNSLYPSVMLNCKYPIGGPVYFEGNLFNYNPHLFGFFYCKIQTPEYLDYPILQTHYKTNAGIRTISPLGSWSGWYFSEELKNSLKFGYSFEVLKGYYFKSDYLFKGYVSDLYNLRLKYSKSDPMNYIAKILLNSLYGRFGMDDNFSETEILSGKDYLEMEKDNSVEIIDSVQLKDKYMVTSKYHSTYLNTRLDNGNEFHNVNIAIASAVTAYARIHMSQFKDPKFLRDNDLNLYYTDTDSLYFDNKIPETFISNTILGKLKLEGIFDEAIFLAPKVYALKNMEGEIIKIKGLSKKSINYNGINLDTLYQLLLKGSINKFNPEKWYKHLNEGTISILDQIYTLKVTSNKRELVFDSIDNTLIGTKPLVI